MMWRPSLMLITNPMNQPMGFAIMNTGNLKRGARASILAFGFLAGMLQVQAADLGISDGVVVKFGSGAGVEVLDAVHLSNQATLTSIQDDTALGQTGAATGTPAKGDWRGVKLEASATPGNVRLEDIRLRYGGGAGSAALDIRKSAPTVKFIVVKDSIVGVRVTDGAAPVFTGVSLINNTTGLEVGGNAIPTLTGSEIFGNTNFGINNLTPASAVQATGTWWGDASGPKDAIANPNGKGDVVSVGVNYGSVATVVPLINPTLSIVGNNTYTDQANITLNLRCRNAVEYRVSESNVFTGIAFSPMTASTSFTLSSGDGIK